MVKDASAKGPSGLPQAARACFISPPRRALLTIPCALASLAYKIEIFVEGRAPEVTDAARQGHLNENSHRSNEGAPVTPRPPSAIRPPSAVTGVSPEEYGTKFIRSAGLVAGAVKKNLSHVGNSIKEMVGDIFHSDGSGTK